MAGSSGTYEGDESPPPPQMTATRLSELEMMKLRVQITQTEAQKL
jgi:hypothetical protein